MDINALKTFIEVAKTNHFGKAAENLFVSQSTVSARIKALEDDLGTELFIRERSNIHLSKNGEALVSHAKSILTLWGRARQEIAIPDGIQDTLMIGGLPGLWDITLQNWLSSISSDLADFAITADVYTAKALFERVMNGSLDVGFLYDAPMGLNLISQPLKTIELRLVCSEPVASVAVAMGTGFIKVDWGAGFAVEFAAMFPEMTSAKLTTTLGRIASEYLKQNRGCAYLAEPAIKNAVEESTLFNVPNAPVFKRQAYAIYHQENVRAELIQGLISSL